MKPLKPSHREKKRYLLIKGKNANKKDIDDAILEYIGILGYASASPKIIKSEGNNVILSVNRQAVDKVRASFVLCGKDIKIERVSGSVKKVE